MFEMNGRLQGNIDTKLEIVYYCRKADCTPAEDIKIMIGIYNPKQTEERSSLGLTAPLSCSSSKVCKLFKDGRRVQARAFFVSNMDTQAPPAIIT
jgi:hypothetical protein